MKMLPLLSLILFFCSWTFSGETNRIRMVDYYGSSSGVTGNTVVCELAQDEVNKLADLCLAKTNHLALFAVVGKTNAVILKNEFQHYLVEDIGVVVNEIVEINLQASPDQIFWRQQESETIETSLLYSLKKNNFVYIRRSLNVRRDKDGNLESFACPIKPSLLSLMRASNSTTNSVLNP